MTEEKVKGIVLKLSDYKEADKLASVFTLEQGIITCKFTSVKKEKAKLKAIAQPFVFAEFNLTKKMGLNQIINATLLDNFYPILSNYTKTICGYIVLDILKTILPLNKPEPELFLLTLNELKEIESNNEYIALINYILRFIEFSGMGLEFPETDYVYLDKINGDFSTSRTINCLQLDKKVYITLKQINNQETDIQANENVLKQILRLLHNIIFIKFNEEIKSFDFI